MPAEKRKRVDAYEDWLQQPTVLDESDHEDDYDGSEVNKHSKKRKTAYTSHWFSGGDTSSATFSRSISPPVCSEPEEPPKRQVQLVQKPLISGATTSEPEDPWGTDRDGLRQAVFGLWEQFSTSTDGSLDEALSRLVGIATDLKDHPGRSPAYKISQANKVGKSRLLNLPVEIRNVIWEFANPPEVSCCLTGTKCHDDDRSRALKPGDWDSSLIRALVGRGIPVNRQVLWETRGVATPIGARFCSWTCANMFIFRIKDAYRPARRPGLWQRGRLWRDIQKLEVDMQPDMKNRVGRLSFQAARAKTRERFDLLLRPKLDRCQMAGAKWTSYTIDNTYVLEKISNEIVEEPDCEDN